MDGVLCRTQHRVRLALLSGWCGRSPEAIQEAIFESGFEHDAECGRLSADEYLRGYSDRLQYPLTAEQWVHARRTAMEPDTEVLGFAKALGANLQVAMFTNNPFLLQRHFDEVFPAAADLFGTRAVFSAELGHRKPAQEAFGRLAVRLGVAPDEILYFDDDASYVEGARAVGLSAVVVGGATDVLAGLTAHGLNELAS